MIKSLGRRTNSRISAVSVCLAVMMVLAACGGPTTSTVSAEGIPISGGAKFVPATETSANNGLPIIDVIDLSDGSVVNLAAAAPNDKATLLWFWAPN